MQMKERKDPDKWAEKCWSIYTWLVKWCSFKNLDKALSNRVKCVSPRHMHPGDFKDNIVDKKTKLTWSSMVTALWTTIYTTLGGVWMTLQQPKSVPDPAPTPDRFTVVHHKKKETSSRHFPQEIFFSFGSEGCAPHLRLQSCYEAGSICQSQSLQLLHQQKRNQPW